MKFLYIFLIEILSIIFISCNSKDNESKVAASGIINISGITDTPKNLIEKIEYLELEFKNDFPIGEISKVLVKDSILVILDKKTQSIFIYEKTGKFLKVISDHGKGPGEFQNINDFRIFDYNLYILVNRSKIYVYDLKGNWKKEIDLDKFYADEFQITDKNIWCISNYARVNTQNDRYCVRLCSLSGKVVKCLIPYDEKFRCIKRGVFNQSSCLSQELHFILPYSNIIYNVKGNESSLRYSISSKYKTLSLDVIKNERIKEQLDIFKLKKIFDILNYLETSHLILLQYNIDGSLYSTIYLKDKKITSTFKNNDFNYPAHLNIFPIIAGIDEHSLIGEIPSYVAFQIRKKGLAHKYNKDFSKIINDMNDLSNPILAFYYLNK